MGEPREKLLPWIIGRYALHRPIASGGMASVHLGRLLGPGGFGRMVAIKRLHPQYARDPEFVAMFLDEARLAARVQHPNVVPTIDIVTMEGELFLVMEHVHGESLSRLTRVAQLEGKSIPLPIVVAIMSGALNGLHAAHETKDERGKVLGIVHRDVSPQNILVGVDGVPRVLDFGVAKAGGRLQTTLEGQLKGKIAYMAPEQLRQTELDRTADLYAAAVVLWEMLTLERLFQGDNQAQVVAKVLEAVVPPPSQIAKTVPPAIDAVVARGVDRDPAKRFATGREMAMALESAIRPATSTEVGAWVASVAAELLQVRADQIAEIEALGNELTSGVETQGKLFLATLASSPDFPITTEEIETAVRAETSSAGVSSSAQPRPPMGSAGVASRRVLTFGAFGVGALVLVGVGVAAAYSIGSSRAPEAAAKATAVAESVDARIPISEPKAPASATTSEEVGAAGSAVAPPASVGASTAAAPRVPKAASPSTPRPAVATPGLAKAPSSAAEAASAKTGTDCEPPYVIDPDGQKHYKRQCF